MAPVSESQRRNRTQRIQIALIGLLCVGLAVFVTGSLVNPAGKKTPAQQAAIDKADSATANQAGKDDPLADIGAAPVAKTQTDEAIPGTGATVNQVTGNVSDIPAPPRR